MTLAGSHRFNDKAVVFTESGECLVLILPDKQPKRVHIKF